jgi:hypothetical protein
MEAEGSLSVLYMVAAQLLLVSLAALYRNLAPDKYSLGGLRIASDLSYHLPVR